MPTITDVRRLLVAAALAMSAWFGGMAGLALLIPPSAAIVFGPTATVMRAADRADVYILSFGHGFIVARITHAGTVRRLYAGGAWLIWPSIPRFCGF